MPPRPPPNPAPRTAAARDALKAFYCSLCQKGYARATEFEAHESSYDHQHKKRLKEMREMQRDPGAASRARKAERRAEERSGGGLITIKPVKLGGGAAEGERAEGAAGAPKLGAGFKKGGFKSAFGGGEKVRVLGEVKAEEAAGEVVGSGAVAVGGDVDVSMLDDGGESESDVEGERYDPWRPTGCREGCRGRIER